MACPPTDGNPKAGGKPVLSPSQPHRRPSKHVRTGEVALLNAYDLPVTLYYSC